MEVSCIVESEFGQSRTTWNLGSVSAAGAGQVCESSLRTWQCPSSPSPTRGNPMYNQRNSRDVKYDTESALGNGRNTSGRVVRVQSFAEEATSAPGVRSHARRPNYQTLEGPARNLLEVYTSFDQDVRGREHRRSPPQCWSRYGQRRVRRRVVGKGKNRRVSVLVLNISWQNRSHSNVFLEEQSSKRTILSTLGAEASAFRDALDPAEHTQAQ